jgi:hypothetical protein
MRSSHADRRHDGEDPPEESDDAPPKDHEQHDMDTHERAYEHNGDETNLAYQKPHVPPVDS